MTAAELATLVSHMRHFQKEYHRTRSKSAEDDARRWARAVDKAVETILLERESMLFEK